MKPKQETVIRSRRGWFDLDLRQLWKLCEISKFAMRKLCSAQRGLSYKYNCWQCT